MRCVDRRRWTPTFELVLYVATIRVVSPGKGAGGGDPNAFAVPHDAAASSTRHGRVGDAVLVAQLATLLALDGRQRTRVGELDQTGRLKCVSAAARDVDADRVLVGGSAKWDAAHVAKDGNGTIRGRVSTEDVLGRDVVEAIGEEVGVRVPKDQRAKLGDRDEPAQVEDLAVWVAAVEDAAEVEHLCSVVDLCPEAVLEPFLLSLESGRRLDEIEMGQDADDLGHAVRGED